MNMIVLIEKSWIVKISQTTNIFKNCYFKLNLNQTLVITNVTPTAGAEEGGGT